MPYGRYLRPSEGKGGGGAKKLKIMNTQTKLEAYLEQNKLGHVFPLLKKKIEATGSWELQEELTQAERIYAAMLRFIVMGIVDNGSKDVRSQLWEKTNTLYHRAERMLRLKNQSSDKYATTLKSLRTGSSLENVEIELETICESIKKLRRDDYATRASIKEKELAELYNRYEETMLRMFNLVWTSDTWTNADYDMAYKILQSAIIEEHAIALLVSSTMLALTEMFDSRKLMLLLDAYLHSSPIINQRAMVGIVLVLKKYDYQIKPYKEVISRLSLYDEDPNFVKDFYTVMMQLQLSKLTDKISARMRDDIIPSIMNSSNFRKTKFGIEEIDAELTKHGENPEWHKNKNDEKATAKIHEMTELQMEGADVYMSTFSHMKSHPFFQHTAHWFYPFNMDTPAQNSIRNIIGKNGGQIIRTILRTAPFCDSDKYSFCFMLSSIGEMAQESLEQQISSQMLGEEANSAIEEAIKRKPKASDISRGYIQDLYRFFKIYPYHIQFENPFDEKLPTFSPLNIRITEEIMQEHYEERLSHAEFLMRKEFYDDALRLFQSLRPKKREEDADIWQKIGFCQQKTGDLNCYESYTIADELCPHSKWILTHRAQAAYNAGKTVEALECYERLVEMEEENIKLLAKKAECLCVLDKYDEALPILYKANYIDEKSLIIRRMLGWTLFMTHNLDKAKILLTEISKETNDAKDILMLGHYFLATQQPQEAFNAYKRVFELTEISDAQEGAFEELFTARKQELMNVGIEEHKIDLMLEAVYGNYLLNDAELFI